MNMTRRNVLKLLAFATIALPLSGCDDVLTGPSPSSLADYVEGFWHPVLGGSQHTSGQVYHSQHGEYVRIGNQVTVHATITLVQKGRIEGNLEIQGLPFPSRADHDSACTIGDFDDAATEQAWVGGIIGSNATVVQLRHRDSFSRAMSPMTGEDVGDRTALQMSCVYIAGKR